MAQQTTRREILKSGLAAAGLGMLGIPEWAMPALAQGETLVEFTDLPEKIVLVPTADRRIIDIRHINGVLTPRDQFATTQHYGHPEVDRATFRLKVSGMVDKPLSLSLDDLKQDAQHRRRLRLRVLGQPSSAAGADRQRPLDRRLAEAGARRGGACRRRLERFVFFGADHGEEEVDFRGTVSKLDQQFGRSLDRDDALVGRADPGLRDERRAAHAPTRDSRCA